MKMKKSLKRMVSFLLVLAMVFGLLPAIGITMVSAAAANIEGYLDTVTCIGERTIKVTGWAYDTTLPNTPLEIHIYVGGEAGQGEGTGGIIANVYREDLKIAGKGNGCHGFEAEITVNNSKFAHGFQNVYAYAISTDGSGNPLLSKSPMLVHIKNYSTGYGVDGWTIEDDKCPEKPDGIYRIVPAGNPNFSLDIYWPDDVGLNDGTNLQLYSSHNTDGQLFYLQRIEGTNQVALMNIRSQKYLEVDSGNKNGNVHQNGFLPENNNRRWILHHNADDTYSFESCADGGAKGQYLDISGGNLANGTNIGVWDSNGSAAQKFYLIPSYIYGTRFSSCTGFIRPGTYYVYASGYTGKVLVVDGASIEQSANIHIYTKGTNNFAQVFDIQPDGEGWYTIKNVKSGRFLNANGGSGSGRGANVQQYFDDTDACKWALIPKVSANGTGNDVNYWVVNKATSLYLNRSGGNAPSDKQNVQVWPITPKGVTVGDNTSNIASTWYFCRTTNSSTSPYYYAQTKGSLLNDNTGVAANNYNLNDTISLPIKIYDYPNDGLLFEYAESTADYNNKAFGMLRGSESTRKDNTGYNYTAYAIGQTTYTSGGAGQWKDIETDGKTTYFAGGGKFWDTALSGKTLNKIFQVNHYMAGCDANVNLSYLGRDNGQLSYSVYGTLTEGLMTMGLVKPTLREVNGYRLPDYNDETIAYIADLLEKTLRIKNDHSDWYEAPKGEAKYGTQLGFGSNTDLPGILVWVLNYNNGSSGLPSYERSNNTTRRDQLRRDLEMTLQKTEQLTGTWQQCWQNIKTYTDAAYFILNNLFVPRSYNLPQDQFDYLVLSKAKLTNGKTGYVFDAGFTTTVSALDSGVSSAVKYDLNARTISNTSMDGKALYQYANVGATTRYPFLPVFIEGSTTTQDMTKSPYSQDDGVKSTASADVAADTYQNRNFNYVLQSNGVFTYDENEGLFFDFEGDDDVYLFINGQLVLDIGGAHSITKVSMNLNDYVFDARSRVANGTATARDRALALEDGKEYSFDFYYMERHGYGANMRIATNIRVSDPNLGTNKKAYQNGLELNYGGIVTVTAPVEYAFELTNPAASTANLYRLTFKDEKLGVTLDSTNGLTVSAGKAVNSAGGTLTAADLKVYYTNRQGSRSEVALTGSTAAEKNESLKKYLTELNGNGLLPGCSIEIQGMYLKLAESDFDNGRYENVVYVTANQKADGTGNTYQDSAKMVVCIPSGPHYYQWSGKTLTVDKTKFVTDVNAILADEKSALREQLGAVTSLNSDLIDSIQLCNMNGTNMTSSNVDATADRISIHFSSPGSYTFYVKVHQKDGTQVIVPLQAYVPAVNDSVFVLDYGLKADLGTIFNKADTLSVTGRSTNYQYEGIAIAETSYGNNSITMSALQNVGETDELTGLFKIHSAMNENIVWALLGDRDGTRVIQSWYHWGGDDLLFYIYPDALHSGYYRIMSYTKGTYLTRIHDGILSDAIDYNDASKNGEGYVALTGYAAEQTGQYWKIIKNADGTASFISAYDVGNNTGYQLTLMNEAGDGINATDDTVNSNYLRAWKAADTVDAAYRSFTLEAKSYGNYVRTALPDGNVALEYHPTRFMEGADSFYAAVRVYEGTPSSAIGTVNINTEVEMYKKITVLPANVVYYEDDFPAIKYYGTDKDGNSTGDTKNTFTTDGSGSGAIYQSADQSTQYGFDAAYNTGTTMSGNSGHVIKIYDTKVAAEFTFVGTGFELIGRSMVADKGVMYLDVLNESGGLVKRIPVILEYEDTGVTTQTEGIYQVPIVRVDGLTHGKYKVQIYGVPAYQKDANGNYIKDENGKYVVETNPDKAPTLFIDGVRIYNPLADTDANREHYIDGEDTAKFLEIRNLILKGKAAVVSFEGEGPDGPLELTTNTSTYTENRNGVTYPVNTFQINSVAQSGYFVDAETKTGATDYPPINLRTAATARGNNQFVFTFAKTENNTDYYYIHIYSGGHERYLKRSAVTGNADIMLVSKKDQDPATKDPDCFLWKITSLDKAQNIVTIQSKYDSSYLSVATVDASAKTGTIQAVSTGTITDAQKWKLGAIASQTVFKGNKVNSVNDYLVFGPNNELYLDGVKQTQALAFYFTPDGNTTTTTMLQVGVHVLNDQRLIGGSGDLEELGALYQSAYSDGITGWKPLDENIQTSTERYYPIDLSLCKYDAKLNRYEVVLYCGGGYLSFTNLKVSGGTIETITGETADLRYNNGVLELLTTVGVANTRTWVPVEHPESYPDFASLTKQMSSTTMYELDADTGEFVPALIESDAKVALAGRSLLFKDIIKMRFYFDISATGVTTASPENSGLLVWSEEEYAALDTYTVDTAGKKIRGLTHSVNGYYADTQGIPAKNMVDKLYVRAYVILPDGSYEYSDITEFSPVMYAQIILEKESSSETMKELVIALMNYGAAAQKRFNYKTDNLMNAWLPAEQQTVAWSDEWINSLPTDTAKVTFEANDQITMVGSSVTFVGAVNQNFYFNIPAELTQNATKIELLYWTASEYEEMTELTVANAHHVDYDPANGRAVIEGTAAKNLGNSFYLVLHIVNEEGDVFSTLFLDSAHDYARRVLASASTSDAMKELAQTLVIYSNKAKAQLGG